MVLQPRVCHLVLIALVAFAVSGPAGSRCLYGQVPTASAAIKRAESERKSRENIKKAEDHRKEVETRHRELRKQLNLPESASRGAGSPRAKPKPGALSSSSPPDAEALLKKWNLPDPRSAANTQSRGKKKDAVGYAPVRGQEFAFLVEMSAQERALQRRWVGTPYFACIFSDVGRSFPEMFCIGNLACRIRSSPERPWSASSIEDIELPQRFMFGSHGVMNTSTTGLFDEHTLPLQLSALLTLEELIFPTLPAFSDSPRNESKEPATFYLRGGRKNIFGDTATTSLAGEFERKSRIEDEYSATPRIVNERAFHCPSQGIRLGFRQVGTLNASDGMIVNVDLEYLLELGDEAPLTVKVRRLSGTDLETARAQALKKLPPASWPEYFRRIPAESDSFAMRLPRSADDIPAGQQVSVSIDITERDAHGSRDYLATTIAGAPQGKVRIRLEGSQEQMDVSPSDLRLPK